MSKFQSCQSLSNLSKYVKVCQNFSKFVKLTINYKKGGKIEKINKSKTKDKIIKMGINLKINKN